MNLRQRSYEPELLDQDNIPFADIRQNMQELDTINTWLGGHAITITGLRQLIGNRRQVHICEIGCGGGDNLAALQRWCRHRGITARFTGIDLKAACIEVAREKKDLQTNTTWMVSDYRAVRFGAPPDIVFSSLFCHHFSEAELVEQLRWMQASSRIGFFINDLHRHRLAYASIRLLTRLFSRSYLVRNDAPLSVARGLKRKEWANLLHQAGIRNATLRWRWAFRWLIVATRNS